VRFVYRYRTRDNVEHRGEISAATREDAFAAIRALGVKPSGLAEADGFFNKLFGKGKRWLAIVALSIVALIVLVLWLRTKEKMSEVLRRDVESPRHQIYGDPEVMRSMEVAGFSNCLHRVGDRVLAQFAQPGNFVAAKGCGIDDVAAVLSAVVRTDLEVSDAECREVRELKQIVNGMRTEMREYLSDGLGSYQSYFGRLIERYRAEKQIHDRVSTELQNEKSPEVWSKKNEALRRMGVAVIVRPEE